MSGTADHLLNLIYEWRTEAETCSSNLKGLAVDLESLRETCNMWETVGNTVAAVGSGVSIAAAFVTGGTSLFLAGMFTGLAGTGTSLVTKLTEMFMANDKLKKVEEIDEKCNKIQKNMEDLFEKLKKQCPSNNKDDQEEHAVQEFLKAISRHNKLDVQPKDLDEIIKGIIEEEQANVASKDLNTSVVYVVISVLALFSLGVEGEFLGAVLAIEQKKKAGKATIKGAAQLQCTLLSAAATQGAKELGKSAALRGASKFLGGAVGLAFSLPDAISSWKEAIKDKHETVASKQLRDLAKEVEKSVQDLSNKLNVLLKSLKEAIDIHGSKIAAVAVLSYTLQKMNLDSNESQQVQDINTEQQAKNTNTEQQAKNTNTEQQANNSQTNQTSGNGSGSTTNSDPPDRQDDDEEEKRDGESERSQDSESESEKSQESEGCSDSEREFESSSEVEEVLNMALVNARSLNKFIDDRNRDYSPTTIINVVEQNNLDVFLVTETWLRENSQTNNAVTRLLPDDYSIYNVPRPSEDGRRRGGGVAIIHRNNIESLPVIFNLIIRSFEYVATAIRSANAREPSLILNIYRPPRGNVNTFVRNFLREFQSLLSEAYARFRNVIIGGDFNVWVDRVRNWRAQRFQQNTRENNLVQHVSESTHRNGRTLDLVLSRSNVRITIVLNQPTDFSDHNIIVFIANLRVRRRRNRRRQ